MNIKQKIQTDHQIIDEVFKIKNSLNTILKLTNYPDLELRIGSSEEDKKMNKKIEDIFNKVAEIITKDE